MTARQYLKSRSWLGKKFGMRTMRALVAELGHPEKAFRSLLIAGTNGKGSVSAYLDRALRASGLRTGCYTSPHLIDIRERITVDGRQIGNAAFERLVLTVRGAATALLRRGRIPDHPNHFEILTVVAFLHFRERGVEAAVLEVGLGGRLDATNVASPSVSAIVSIDFDHEEYLGHTLAAIALEKAGVARAGRALVVGPMKNEALTAIRRKAKETGARVVGAFDRVTVKSRGNALEVRTPACRYARVSALPGAHQRSNVVVAIRTLEEFAVQETRVSLKPAVAAMSDATWPGRLERFPGTPPILLDGAHNPAGAAALAAYLQERRLPHILVFGAMRDKHIDEMADHLFASPRIIVATRVRMKRAATTAQIARIARAHGRTAAEAPNVAAAIAEGRRLARPGETIVIAGSLYLVGAARRALLKKSTRT